MNEEFTPGNVLIKEEFTETFEIDLLQNETDIGEDDSNINMDNNDEASCIEPKDEEMDIIEAASASQQFQVNRSIIPSVCKEDQASELQDIYGLSVYDQDKFEAGVLEQVDDALEKQMEVTHDIKPILPNVGQLQETEEETEQEKKIRLGEMTPFGSTLSTPAVPSSSKNAGMSILEKYLRQQQELSKKVQIKPKPPSKLPATSSSAKNAKELVVLENYIRKQQELGRKMRNKPNPLKNKDPLKRKILNRDGRKKARRKKENLGSETQEYCEEKPVAQPGEKSYVYPESASGSEYIPSESDGYSSEEKKQKKWSGGSLPRKKKLKMRKSRYALNGITKIPEDWRSDDSDWEFSDEEDVFQKKKRRKELDDGDVDEYNSRIRHLERTKQDSNEEDGVHELEGDFQIPNCIWNKLYNYQKVGVQWLWELDQQRCGGILGDEMGLGKTIQVIAFLAGLHTSQLKDKDTKYRGLGPSIIVCPTTVMHQWVKEFHKWFPILRVAVLHESGTFVGKDKTKLIRNIHSAKGLLITSYTGVIQHKDALLQREWHYIILDEGHKIRNPDAQVTQVVKQFTTSHRIILSGSPMQNNLKELWSLFDFVFPGKLGTLPVFLAHFDVPITQGGYANASQVQVMTAFKCATILKDSIAPYLLRRMKVDVQSHVKLPEKNEQVLFCRLTEEQRRYYKSYLDTPEVDRILQGHAQIFIGLINLRKICNHPDLYSGGTKLFTGESEENLREEDRYGHWRKAGKMIVVETLLKIWKKQGHRVLIFTQSRQMLCILEAFIKQQGYVYLKLDGATSIGARQPIIDKFNQDTSYFAMLLTTRVGGLGVNLTGANRVLIYDPDWNPATDTQARERAWRIGQKQSVTVYRLITAGTIEEKMYHRQIFKQFLCNKVLKDPKQRRFFKSNDLFELFTLKESDVDGSTETGAIFAGTGSEVKLDPTKSYRCRKAIDPKKESESPSVTFSKKKILLMKKLAQRLSKKISVSPEKPNQSGLNDSGFESNKDENRLGSVSGMNECKDKAESELNESVDTLKCVNEIVEHNTVNVSNTNSLGNGVNEPVDKIGVGDNAQPSTSYSDNNCKLVNDPKVSNIVQNNSKEQEHKKHKKHKKHKRKTKDAYFEGETVPHLVRHDLSANTENCGEEEKNYATQDEYVLRKLFSKSGLQTALKHDTIMEGGPADYVLVEVEADRVAKQAIEEIKKSRRECHSASTGVPTFTGINGIRKKSIFGTKSTTPGAISSSEIINRIRQRNVMPVLTDPDTKLLSDIREYLMSQGGTATTTQIISQFEKRLPENSSPLFRSLLMQISTFYRAPDKLGYWTLKEEFNW